jgi:Type VI secretion system, TssC, VipB
MTKRQLISRPALELLDAYDGAQNVFGNIVPNASNIFSTADSRKKFFEAAQFKVDRKKMAPIIEMLLAFLEQPMMDSEMLFSDDLLHRMQLLSNELDQFITEDLDTISIAARSLEKGYRNVEPKILQENEISILNVSLTALQDPDNNSVFEGIKKVVLPPALATSQQEAFSFLTIWGIEMAESIELVLQRYAQLAEEARLLCFIGTPEASSLAELCMYLKTDGWAAIRGNRKLCLCASQLILRGARSENDDLIYAYPTAPVVGRMIAEAFPISQAVASYKCGLLANLKGLAFDVNPEEAHQLGQLGVIAFTCSGGKFFPFGTYTTANAISKDYKDTRYALQRIFDHLKRTLYDFCNHKAGELMTKERILEMKSELEDWLQELVAGEILKKGTLSKCDPGGDGKFFIEIDIEYPDCAEKILCKINIEPPAKPSAT